MQLEKTTYINSLFDFYQHLLTPKQKKYMELYYWEDYSLGEISENVHVSRQAIYDNIKRTGDQLRSYEYRLGLYDTFIKRKQIISMLEETISEGNREKSMELIRELKEMD